MIDEKKLIDDLENLKAKTIIFKSDLTFNNAIDTAIDTVKEQTKVNEWIPVDKELPKQLDKNGDMVSKPVFVTIYDSAIKKYFTMIDCMVEGEWTEEKFNKNFKVTAWMPKPKRYGGKENE